MDQGLVQRIESKDEYGKKVNLALVIPLKNEGSTIEILIKSILTQTLQPSEIILVDGGSTDNTVQFAKKISKDDSRFRIIEAGIAMPGKGRNIGVAHAKSEWIAFTDAGICLDKNWLKNLVLAAGKNNETAIIYGNYSPQINSFFDKCATIAYVTPATPGNIRGKFIASCLLKKQVWEKTGGFPDWRATEDLVFMENAEKAGFQVAVAPDAMVYWQLRPGIASTFKRFDLYSKYNVWAGRQAYWHYGVARQYALMAMFVLLGIFHFWYWILLLPLWMAARVVKRIFIHRNEFGLKTLFNPAVFFMVMVITLVIDAATFSGWIKAILQKPKL